MRRFSGATGKEAARTLRLSAPVRYPTPKSHAARKPATKQALGKQVFAELPETDQNHAEIKLAFTKSINELLTLWSTTLRRDEAEVAKLTAQRKRRTGNHEARRPKLLKNATAS